VRALFGDGKGVRAVNTQVVIINVEFAVSAFLYLIGFFYLLMGCFEGALGLDHGLQRRPNLTRQNTQHPSTHV
jgi:hypothetical protein